MESMTYVKDLLKKSLHSETDDFYCEAIAVKNFNNETLKDFCMDLGDYVNDDEEKSAYVIRIERKLHNSVIMALYYDNGMLYMACKADDGLLNKDSGKNAVDFVRKRLDIDEKALSENSDKKSIESETGKKKKPIKLFIILIIVVLLVCGGLFCYFRISNVNKYNKVVTDYNQVATEYNDLLKVSSVDGLDGFPSHVESKEELPTGLSAIFSTDDVDSLTEEMENLLGHYVALGQITNPSVDIVKNQIKDVEGMQDIQEVTTDNDPNEMLGKENGYTGCLYFSHELVDQTGLDGKTVIEKGTDCGGSIEIFKDKTDAKLRDDYLTQFDDTLLYSGSHKVVGTMVIRISYRLSDESQETLTDVICNAIMSVNIDE